MRKIAVLVVLLEIDEPRHHPRPTRPIDPRRLRLVAPVREAA